MRIKFLVFVVIMLLSSYVFPKEKEQPSLIVFDIMAEEGVKKGVSNLLTEMVLVEIDKMKRFKVIGQKDLDKMLFWESNKQLKNCTDSSCLVQIAGAMGAEYYVEGSVGVVGDKYIVTLKLMDAMKASVINRLGEAVDKNENVMLQTIIKMTVNLMKPIIGEVEVKGDGVEKKEVVEEKKEVVEGGGIGGIGLIMGARGYMDVISRGGSYDISVGYELMRYVEILVGAGKLKYLQIKPRMLININPDDGFEFYGILQGSMVFTEDKAYGVGGGMGVRYNMSKSIDIMAEVPVEYYIQIPEGQEKLRILPTFGLGVNF